MIPLEEVNSILQKINTNYIIKQRLITSSYRSLSKVKGRRCLRHVGYVIRDKNEEEDDGGGSCCVWETLEYSRGRPSRSDLREKKTRGSRSNKSIYFFIAFFFWVSVVCVCGCWQKRVSTQLANWHRRVHAVSAACSPLFPSALSRFILGLKKKKKKSKLYSFYLITYCLLLLLAVVLFWLVRSQAKATRVRLFFCLFCLYCRWEGEQE